MILTPEDRDLLAFCSLAFQLQPVERGVYHRGFIAYNRLPTRKREISTDQFCALIKAVRLAERGYIYIDRCHNVRSKYDDLGDLMIAVYDPNNITGVQYQKKLSRAMVAQIHLRLSKSDFRWIQQTRRGPKCMTK